MNDLLSYLIDLGYDFGKMNFSSYGPLSIISKHKTMPDIEWGLCVANKPPMLISPQPCFEFYDKETNLREGYSDPVTTDHYIHLFTKDEIIDSMFNRKPLLVNGFNRAYKNT